MKFFSGFMTGVVITLLGVLLWLRKDTPTASPAPAATTVAPDQGMPEDFGSFYRQFHEDSLFQMAHIIFPLQGVPANADSITVNDPSFRWQQADWIMHRPFDDMDGQFDRRFIPLGSDMVIEQIKGVQGQYGMQRRFSRMSDGWYLIYYAGMNKLATAEAPGPATE